MASQGSGGKFLLDYSHIIHQTGLPFKAPTNGILYVTCKYQNTNNSATEGHGGAYYINGILVTQAYSNASYNMHGDSITLVINKNDVITFEPNRIFGITNIINVTFIPFNL